MNILYKRSREEDAYQCGACRTTWKESWVDRQGNQKNVITCPYCHTWIDAKDTDIVRSPAVRYRHKTISTLLRKKYNKEEQLKVMNLLRTKNEGVTLRNNVSTGSLMVMDSMMRARACYYNTAITIIPLEIAEIDEKLRSLINVPYPTPFPATLNQNALTQGSTIKPQIDWVEFDLAMEASEKEIRKC